MVEDSVFLVTYTDRRTHPGSFYLTRCRLHWLHDTFWYSALKASIKRDIAAELLVNVLLPGIVIPVIVARGPKRIARGDALNQRHARR